jgi:hypothetical protein
LRGGVVGQGTILGDLGGKRIVDIRRGQREIGAAHGAGEDDAVIADADFHDLVHAVRLAQVDIRLRDAAGGVGDVDGVLAHALAQFLAAGARTATFHDRRREVEVLAEGFGDDGRIGQHGRRAGDLDLVTGGGGHRGGEGQDRRGEVGGFHRNAPKIVRPVGGGMTAL